MKTIQDFIELFAEQFEETESSTFTSDTKFHDLDEWSSLIGLSVIAMIDEEFDVVVKGDELRSMVTINDLYELVARKACN